MTSGGPFDPLTFFQAVDDFQQSGGSSNENPQAWRLATVDPNYLGSGPAKVTFDGETAVTAKAYAYIDSAPLPGDRVVLAPFNDTYIILGTINFSPVVTPPNNGYPSTARPSNPYTGQIIYETDTGYVRVWSGTAWQFVQAPDISVVFASVSNGTGKVNTGDNIINWDQKTVNGDIQSPTNARVLFNRPGIYRCWGSCRLIMPQSSTQGNGAVYNRHCLASGSVKDVISSADYYPATASGATWGAAHSFAGDMKVDAAGEYCEMYSSVTYTGAPLTIDRYPQTNGAVGPCFYWQYGIRFLRPLI